MKFVPSFCPKEDCRAHNGAPFQFHCRGFYRRACDGLVVQRFSCVTCGRRFSRQSFRLNYRWRLPNIHIELFGLLVSKVTMRQSARLLEISRDTVTRRMRTLGAHCRAFQEEAVRRTGVEGAFQLDEMETFETDRLVRPVTVPVLIETTSLFVLHAETAPLPPRGRLDAYRQLRKLRDERLFGPRKSRSRAAVESTLLRLKAALPANAYLDIRTDRKSSYRKLIRTHFGHCLNSHAQVSSRDRRNRENPLFGINHTLAMMRDGVSRLVRRSWGASKLRSRLDDHLWIWMVYRNFVRGITVSDTRTTPAMAAGVAKRRLKVSEVLKWRWPSMPTR